MFSTAQPSPARHAVQTASRRAALVRFGWLLCCACFLGTMAPGFAEDSVSKEYQIKAAYLYNFAKFVAWPPETFASDQSPLVIGVYGQNPFGEALEAIARDHQINGRPIKIKFVNTAADAAGVHLLFFSAAEDDHVAATLSALPASGVLTVGESDKFMTAGGVINFIREDDKVRFEINTRVAEQQRLKISAQLLKLARAVRRNPAQARP